MNFDEKWEIEIYRKRKQINRYPYDSIVSSVYKNFKHRKVSNSIALDLGCGTGNNLKFLINYGFNKVIGIDGSKSAIEEAKKIVKSKKCKLICADFNKYDLGNNKYDLIIDRGSVTHNTKQSINKILNKIKKGLTKNGILISHMFSTNHSEFKNLKFKKSFKKSMDVSIGMTASFFSKKDIMEIFTNFKILSINHVVDEDIFTKDISAFWQVALRNK